jgi:hypothetical protein
MVIHFSHGGSTIFSFFRSNIWDIQTLVWRDADLYTIGKPTSSKAADVYIPRATSTCV